MGDSAPLPASDRRQDPYAAIHSKTIVEDVEAAAAWLKKRGYDSIVLFGICSGAYSALRAALAEPAITGVVAVNLHRFYVPDGFALDTAPEQVNSMAGYRSSMLEWSKWLQIFSGERSVAPIARAIVAQAVARVRSRVGELVRLPGSFSQSAGTPTDPRSVVKALERKGVRTLLVYGAFDSGLDQLTTHFGKKGKRLSRFSMVSAAVFQELDHSLFNPHASAKVISLCEAFIKDLGSRKGGRT
jgi:pimeloyl-ACP methyl ester carboxylesterase